MIKYLFQLFSYRIDYKKHFLVMHIMAAVLALILALDLTFLLITVSGNDSFGLITLILFVALIIVILVVLLYMRVVAASRSKYEMLNERFGKNCLLDNEALFRQSVKKKLKGKHSCGVFCVIEVKGLTALRQNHGQEGIKDLNDAVYDALFASFHDKKEYSFAFSPIKSWMVFKKTDDVRTFVQEIGSLTQLISEKLDKETKLGNVVLLSGVYFAKHGETFDEIFPKAQAASTYNIQSRIQSDVVVFNSDEMADRESSRTLSNELSRALKEEQLQIFYQPKYDIKEECYFGAEALIRWSHPSRGLLPPSLFIPYAEQNGKIVEVDRYVFEMVCRDMKKWKDEGKFIPKVSINLSRKTALDPEILKFYESVMDKYEIDRSKIDIELTESMAGQDPVFVTSMIRKIKSMNVETSIDDFGTGYSSLNTLKRMPFDTLKIDKSFVDEVEIDPKTVDILRCINDMAHSLGMKTICEGIESEGQVKIVKKLGVNYIQGYYFSKPLSEFEFQRFISNNATKSEAKVEEAKA